MAWLDESQEAHPSVGELWGGFSRTRTFHSILAVPSPHGPVGPARWALHDRLPQLAGRHPPSRALLPSRPQRCDLLAAPPRQGPRQEEFKHPQEKPPAIDPRVRLPVRSRAFIKEPGRRGRSAPFFASFLLPPKSFPRVRPPSPRSLGELEE